MIYKIGGGGPRVLLIDDMSRELVNFITKTIAGVDVSPFTLTRSFIDRVKNDSYRVTDSSLWIFDGTYVNEENNTSTLDIAEYLCSNFPQERNNIIVVMGADMNEYCQRLSSDGDYDAKLFLSRVRALPHVIYGDKKYNTKENVIINQIRSFAKRNGYEIQNRLKSGDVAPEILEIANETKEKLRQVLQLLRKIETKDLKDFKPKSDEERDLLNLIETADFYFAKFRHDISNVKSMLDMELMSVERKMKKPNDNKEKQ